MLITRARVRCEVFSNLCSGDIRTAEAPGLQALRVYLNFAEGGRLDLLPGLRREPSAFERALAQWLERAQQPIELQVGSSGFCIDLGLRDPAEPERFLLGIECDGPKYAAAGNARDRDRLRQEVLEIRGWRLHRVWSTDWWVNSEREQARALDAVRRALDAGSAETVAADGSAPTPQATDPSPPSPEIPRLEMVEELVLAVDTYRMSKLRVVLQERELRDVPISEIVGWVLEVVDGEGPVHREEVLRRIREAAGLARLGNATREVLIRGIQQAVESGRISVRDAFLWPLSAPPLQVRNRSSLPAASRKLDYVPREEIQEAIRQVVAGSFGAFPSEAILLALRRLGFERPGEELSQRLEALIAEMIQEGQLAESGGQLKPPS